MRIEQFQPLPGNSRRIRIRPRSQNEFTFQSKPAPNRTPTEQVTIITGGVNIRIEGIQQTFQRKPVGTIDLSADRMVIWSRGDLMAARTEGVEQSNDEPFEVYMEGNIVILQGDPANPKLERKVYAKYATYDARDQKALLLEAELETYVPSLQSNIRVWGERIQELGPNAFHAQNAWVSPSPYGKPGYRMQSSDVFLEQREDRSVLGAGPPPVDPTTGLPRDETSELDHGYSTMCSTSKTCRCFISRISALRPKTRIFHSRAF